MTNRDWFCLALRLLGIWLLIEAIESIVPYLSLVLSANSMGVGATYSYFFLWIGCRTFFGLLLLLFAPAITTRFYPIEKTKEPHGSEVGEVNLLKVGIQLLGVYALLLAIQPVAEVVLGILNGSASLQFSTADINENYLTGLLTIGINAAFATVLLMWDEQVVTFLTRLRYVPERDAYEPPPLEE